MVVEGDQQLFNQCGIILNPEKPAPVKKALGQQLIDWVISTERQDAIKAYTVNGLQLFFPNAAG